MTTPRSSCSQRDLEIPIRRLLTFRRRRKIRPRFAPLSVSPSRASLVAMIYLVAEKFIPSDQRRATNTLLSYSPPRHYLRSVVKTFQMAPYQVAVSFLFFFLFFHLVLPSKTTRSKGSWRLIETLRRIIPVKYPKANSGIPESSRSTAIQRPCTNNYP